MSSSLKRSCELWSVEQIEVYGDSQLFGFFIAKAGLNNQILENAFMGK